MCSKKVNINLSVKAGMLYGGLTVEQAISGRSKIRNVCIAEVFSRMGIIEQ